MQPEEVWTEVLKNTSIGSKGTDVLVHDGKRSTSLNLRMPESPTFTMPKGTRFRILKLAAMRLLRIYTRFQFRFNDWVVGAIKDQFDAIVSLSASLEERQDDQQKLANLMQSVSGLQGAIRQMERRSSDYDLAMESVSKEIKAIMLMVQRQQDSYLSKEDYAKADQQPLHKQQIEELEQKIFSIDAVLHRMSDSVAELGGKVEHVQSQVDDALTPSANDADEFLNSVMAHNGLMAEEGLWFNPPVVVGFHHQVPKLEAVTERILEHGFVIKNVLSRLNKGASVLDIGCAESLVPLELASHGFMVHGVDFRAYPVRHSNLISYQGDFLSMDFAGKFFDVVLFLSSIEHFGLGWYGDPLDAEADRKSLAKAKSLLVDEGYLIITVPVSERMHVTELQRVYEIGYFEHELNRAGFDVIECEIGRRIDSRQWLVDAYPGPVKEGVMMAVCRKGQS